MDGIKEFIANRVGQLREDAVAIRRRIHQNPELSFEEHETAAFIQEKCEQYGLPFKAGVAGTGIVVEISGKSAEPVVALRADIDALPIQEKNDVSYRSRRDGVMHACGHDVHTAVVLTAARVLYEMKDQLEGTVRVLFQPGEEKLPGGASLMIKEGVLEDPVPVAIFGNHVHPPLEVGKVGYHAGRYMASADELYLRIEGKGGHAALPHDTVDPIAVTAQVITGLQQIISRKGDPLIPSVLTFGKINSEGGATNVITNAVSLEGTFRTMDEAWREEAHGWIEKMVHSICEANGAVAHLEIRKGYPCLDNHESLTERAADWMREYLGDEAVVHLPKRMTAEDFSYYSQVIPACFYRLGTGNPAKGIVSPIHTDTFDIDEDALVTGAGVMAWLAVKALEES